MYCYHCLLSDSYVTRDLLLAWMDGDPIELDKELEMPQFEMYDVKLESDCVKNYQTGQCSLAGPYCSHCWFDLSQFGGMSTHTFVTQVLAMTDLKYQMQTTAYYLRKLLNNTNLGTVPTLYVHLCSFIISLSILVKAVCVGVCFAMVLQGTSPA